MVWQFLTSCGGSGRPAGFRVQPGKWVDRSEPVDWGEGLWAWVGFKGQEPSLEGEGRWAGLERPAEALPAGGQRRPSS